MTKRQYKYICDIHKIEYHQRKDSYNKGAIGCPVCKKNKRIKNNSYTLEEVINKISENNINYQDEKFLIIGYENSKVITKDCFGICEVKKDSLYNNGIPSILNAKNKTEYAINQFCEKWDNI